MSNFMKSQKKIEKTVVSGYQKIEDTVVSGYKKVEDGFVGGYKKIEDSFVRAFLTPDKATPPKEDQREKTQPSENKGD